MWASKGVFLNEHAKGRADRPHVSTIGGAGKRGPKKERRPVSRYERAGRGIDRPKAQTRVDGPKRARRFNDARVRRAPAACRQK